MASGPRVEDVAVVRVDRMTVTVWTVLVAVVAVGVAVQSVLGFGANLLVVPVAVALYPELVPITTTVLNLVLSAAVALRSWRSADRAAVRGVLVGMVVGAAGGVWLVTFLPLVLLGVIAAACVLVAVLVRISGVRAPKNRGTTMGAGVLTGFMAATTSITGPPVALLTACDEPRSSRATVAVTGTVAAAVTAVALLAATTTATGAVGRDVVLLAPGVVAGALVGRIALRRLPRRAVERLVLAVSALSAVVVLARAFL